MKYCESEKGFIFADMGVHGTGPWAMGKGPRQEEGWLSEVRKKIQVVELMVGNIEEKSIFMIKMRKGSEDRGCG